MFYDLSATGAVDVYFEYAGDATLRSTWITLNRDRGQGVTMKLSTFSRLALLTSAGRNNELHKGTNPCLSFFIIDEDDGVTVEPLFDEKGSFKNVIGLHAAKEFQHNGLHASSSEQLEKQPVAINVTLDELQDLASFNLICLQLVHLLATPGLVKPERGILHRVRLLPTSRFHFANGAYDVRFAPSENVQLSGMSIGDWKPSGTVEAESLTLDEERCIALLAMTVEEILTGLSVDGFVQMIDANTKLGVWPSAKNFPPPEPGLITVTEQDWRFICDCMRLYLAMRAFFD